MSIIVIVMEAFMIYKRFRELAGDGAERNFNYWFDNYQSFGIPLVAGFLMLITAIICLAGVRFPMFLGNLFHNEDNELRNHRMMIKGE